MVNGMELPLSTSIVYDLMLYVQRLSPFAFDKYHSIMTTEKFGKQMLSAVEARWEQNAAEELTLVKMKSRGADFYRPFLWDRRGYILTFFYVLRLRSEEWFNIFTRRVPVLTEFAPGQRRN
eukprot:scaffold5091_cov165-Skeletonema_marinoi.AAC.2